MRRSVPTYLMLALLLATAAPLAAQSEAGAVGTPRIHVEDVQFGLWPVVAPPAERFFRIRNTSTDGGELIVFGVVPGTPTESFIFQTPDGYPPFPLRIAAGGESDPIRVTFDPAAPLRYTDSILFLHNAGIDAGNDGTALLNGDGVLSTLTATSMRWHRRRVGTGPYTGIVTLTNVGNQEIRIVDATGAGNASDFTFDFSRVANLTLQGGASVDIPVTFSPKSICERQMVITYNHEAGDVVVTSTLEGIGTEPTLGTHDVHFGTHSTGEVEMEALFYMVSNGTPPCIDSVTIVNLDFVAHPEFRYALSAGMSLPYVLNSLDDTLRVRGFFNPLTSGTKSTTLTAVTEDFNAAGELVQATSNWITVVPGSSSAPDGTNIPGLAIGPIAPTPTDGMGTLSYTIPAASSVEITLVDIAGRMVGTMLQKSMMAAGSHTLRFDLSELPAGSYFCRMVVGESVLVHPLSVR